MVSMVVEPFARCSSLALRGQSAVSFLERWTLSRHLGLAYTLQIVGVCCLILASLMLASSRFGKFHARDRILARLKLRGDETVLDVGCGHGLLLIAAAKLLPRGHAVGIISGPSGSNPTIRVKPR